MCLRIVGKLPKKVPKFGYKVFKGSKYGLYGEFKNIDVERPVGKWLNEKDYRSNPGEKVLNSDNDNRRYPTGWHVFLTLRDARHWREIDSRCGDIRKAEIRKPVAYGMQGSRLPVLVCKWIKISRRATKC